MSKTSNTTRYTVAKFLSELLVTDLCIILLDLESNLSTNRLKELFGDCIVSYIVLIWVKTTSLVPGRIEPTNLLRDFLVQT